MQNVISIEKFKFNSLRKFLTPIYMGLNFSAREPAKNKEKIAILAAAEFFRRLREFHGIPPEELAAGLGVAVESLKSFERGEQPDDRELPRLYVKVFRAHLELEIFCQRIQQFKAPVPDPSKGGLAKAAFRHLGWKSPAEEREVSEKECMVFLLPLK